MSLLKINGFDIAVYKKGDTDSPRLAIVIPGRLDTKDYVHITSHVNYLAQNGYLALSFDPPGTWESPGDIGLYNTTNILSAINGLIDYFDARPTVLVGHSRGGTNAMLAGTTNTYVTHIVAIMSHSGPSTVGVPSEKNAVSTSTRDLPPGTCRTQDRKQFELPYSYFEDQSQYNSLPGLSSSTKPKLFFYGTHDVLVSKEAVEEAYRITLGPKEIQALNSEHDYRLHPKVIDQINQLIGNFLRTN